MPSHLNVDTKYWNLTDEIPAPPVERDIKSWIIGNPSDPLWDIDVLPLTYTDSRWSAFVLDVDAESRQRLCPNPPLTVWDGEDAELVAVMLRGPPTVPSTMDGSATAPAPSSSTSVP